MVTRKMLTGIAIGTTLMLTLTTGKNKGDRKW